MWSHFLHAPILARFWICFVSVRIETWNNYNLEIFEFLEAENRKYAENDLVLLRFYVITSHKKKNTPMTYTYLFTAIKIVPYDSYAIIYLYFFSSITQ